MLSKRIDNRGAACRRLRVKVKARRCRDQPVFAGFSRHSGEGTQIGGRRRVIRPPTENRTRLKAESTLLDSEEIWLSYLRALKNHCSSGANLETTMIYVTHDQAEAMTLANRVVVLMVGLRFDESKTHFFDDEDRAIRCGRIGPWEHA